MINTTAIARALAANLAAQDIRIKHVQALDLIAAGAGHANRHVMAALPEFTPLRRINIALLTSAATTLALHDLDRRQAIIDETTTVLGANALSDEVFKIECSDISLTVADIDSPNAFLQTEQGEAFVAKLVNELYYSRYERYGNDGPMSLKEGNKLAEAILDGKRDGIPAHRAIATHFKFGYDPESYWYDVARGEVETVLDSINSELDDGESELALDTFDWLEALMDPIVEALQDQDKSKPDDLLGSYDKCEMVFLIKPDGHAIDEMITTTKAWSEFDSLYVDHQLQHGLSRLGYSIDDYRRLSGNKLPSHELQRGLKKRPDRLVTPEQLEEMIDNACTQYFLFAVYAVVPVQQLIDLDLTKPMTFSTAAVATYNPFSGTFHEVRVNRPVTVTPKEGELRSGSEGISPDDICGLHLPVFYADLKNKIVAHPAPAHKELDLAA